MTISSYAISETSAVVAVVTQDRWNIDVLPAYKQEGGAAAQRYTVKDDNFLGGGHEPSMSYSYRTARPSPRDGSGIAGKEPLRNQTASTPSAKKRMGPAKNCRWS